MTGKHYCNWFLRGALCSVVQWGKVVATAPTPKLTPVNADGSPIKAAAAKAPATGRRL